MQHAARMGTASTVLVGEAGLGRTPSRIAAPRPLGCGAGLTPGSSCRERTAYEAAHTHTRSTRVGWGVTRDVHAAKRLSQYM